MINPQKFSKSLGDKRLKLGIEMNDLIALSFIPSVLRFLGLGIIESVGVMIIAVAILIVSRRFFERGQITKLVTKKRFMKFDSISKKGKNA